MSDQWDWDHPVANSRPLTSRRLGAGRKAAQKPRIKQPKPASKPVSHSEAPTNYYDDFSEAYTSSSSWSLTEEHYRGTPEISIEAQKQLQLDAYAAAITHSLLIAKRCEESTWALEDWDSVSNQPVVSGLYGLI